MRFLLYSLDEFSHAAFVRLYDRERMPGCIRLRTAAFADVGHLLSFIVMVTKTDDRDRQRPIFMPGRYLQVAVLLASPFDLS